MLSYNSTMAEVNQIHRDQIAKVDEYKSMIPILFELATRFSPRWDYKSKHECPRGRESRVEIGLPHTATIQDAFFILHLGPDDNIDAMCEVIEPLMDEGFSIREDEIAFNGSCREMKLSRNPLHVTIRCFTGNSKKCESIKVGEKVEPIYDIACKEAD